MTESEPLFDQFCAALNGELTTLGCQIRVMPRPSPPRYMMLVDIGDKELGWVPDHIDAASIMAFDEILQCDRRAGGRMAGLSKLI